ncbi:MAG: BACON domain-containing protein [Rikenellaceae bacterium]
MKIINLLPIFAFMKKIIPYIFLLLLMSCVTDDALPTFGVAELSFNGAATNEPQTVKVKAVGEWFIEEDLPAWLSISPLSGLDNGEITIKTNSLNDTGSERTFDVVLNIDGVAVSYLKIINTTASQDALTDGLLLKDKEGYYEKGEGRFVFDPMTMQIGIIDLENSFIISDDQKKILSLSYNKIPEINEVAYISIQSRGIGIDLTGTLSCMTYKKQDGKLWLYNISEKRGFIIKYQ